MAIENPMTITLNNGTVIPQVGLGVFQTPDGAVTEEAVIAALKAGYRHIDTAKIYGNEVSVGKAVRESGVAREDVFVTTKLWNEDIRAGRAREAFEESLQRLDLEYIDLYLIHWPAEGWQQAWRDLEELYKEGKVKAIGVSNFKEHHLQELAEFATITPAADQIESSPQFANRDLVEFAKSKGIAVEAWSPLGGTGGTLLAHPTLAAIGERYGKSPAQVVIRWHLQHGVVVLPKSVHAERIEQNFDVFDFVLSDDDMRLIDGLDEGKRVGPDPDHITF